MRHASRELVAAMRGTYMSPDPDGVHIVAACKPSDLYTSWAVWGWTPSKSDASHMTDVANVDCPDCLVLMRDARGPDHDAVEERRIAAEQSKREDEMERERRGAA